MSKPRHFRGKRKDNGKWVVGWYLQTQEGDRIFGTDLCDEDVYCRFNWEEHETPGPDCDCWAVHPNSVSQSTGRFDKNGVEIFGGMEVSFWRSAPWDDQVPISMSSKVTWNNSCYWVDAIEGLVPLSEYSEYTVIPEGSEK